MNRSTTPRSRRRTIATAGVIAATLTVAGAGAAAAAAPQSAVGQAVGTALAAVGVDWSGMPEGYTKEQYEAFWGAGYQYEDVEELVALWQVEETEAKARAGRMILDGETPPVPPSGSPEDYYRGE
ncbi:conserved hypothetical protein [Cellulomonas flavigena DSM 20109]|uniref:Uncharacterized protein n=1 Tax=Cellulomonas flavigena (strain ATCC 482 / DSM 20109 / BCRC 11376 / JCM 18109 / NBRC 3775 / NCIMB 8073 / NRS 134) TaxID=446466 RepID=D5ULP2_CELFN|nr:hypothetical protein [Cellulomonas flavigena]ADG75998.1 conserved hypothetical protein [Cellulomonas flavigena DSM 20109]